MKTIYSQIAVGFLRYIIYLYVVHYDKQLLHFLKRSYMLKKLPIKSVGITVSINYNQFVGKKTRRLKKRLKKRLIKFENNYRVNYK